MQFVHILIKYLCNSELLKPRSHLATTTQIFDVVSIIFYVVRNTYVPSPSKFIIVPMETHHLADRHSEHSEPILSVKRSVTIHTMLSFDGDFDGRGDGMCKQVFTVGRSGLSLDDCRDKDKLREWRDQIREETRRQKKRERRRQRQQRISPTPEVLTIHSGLQHALW